MTRQQLDNLWRRLLMGYVALARGEYRRASRIFDELEDAARNGGHHE